MSLVTSVGLVLRRNRHLEDDVRLVLFLREVGKVVAILKGAQKISSKLKAIQEPFTEADYQVYLPQQGHHVRLIGGILKDSHRFIRNNIASFSTVSKCCEVIDVLIPYRVPTPDVYDILRETFQSVQAAQQQQLHWILFIVKLLKHLGHGDITSELQLESVLSTNTEKESWRRCLSIVDSHLERVLPWRLKSEVLF